MNAQNFPERNGFNRLFSAKKISCSLFCLVLILHVLQAWAFFSDGKIDDDFSYRSLRIEMSETDKRGCFLAGEILNNSRWPQEGIAVIVYAYDFFDHSLWKETVRIDIVDRFYGSGKGFIFRKKLKRCDVPAKFRFKISGVKGAGSGKKIKQ